MNVNVSTRSLNARYWQIVRTCLREFHGFSLRESRESVQALRRQLREASTRFEDPEMMEQVYHTEALSVANSLAGAESGKEVEDWPRYVSMLQQVHMRTKGQTLVPESEFADTLHVSALEGSPRKTTILESGTPIRQNHSADVNRSSGRARQMCLTK